ncbi:glycosyltransferase family 4 protein [Desulfatibacillum aliphaticivorans]|uniref:glycosyltransferase family 4 protein n=1 Tax=Desulfatibacillum aliphaticivorans TaxID=218208 RepID=UPI0003FFE9E7|nr:glycosyltransferase family 4 protein [Desulfatibacillum aliphaticivorans]
MSDQAKPVLGIILKGYPRISETFISNEILLLEKMGFKIHLISMRHPRESFCHDSVKQIKAPVDYLPQTLWKPMGTFLRHNIPLLIKKPDVYLKALGLAFKRFLRTRKSATFKHLLQAGYVVHKILPQSGVAHLHSHFAHSPTSVAMFTSMLSGLPFSFTAHAKDIYTSDERQLAEKIKLAQYVVTCTEYNRQHLKKIALDGSTPIYRIYHGIDVELFAGSENGAMPKPPYKLFTVARMTAKKGLPTIYKALKILEERGVEFEHTLIGDGDDKEDILALIKELGLESKTKILGTQPHGVVLDQFRKSDLFVLGCEVAKNGDRDGIPNVFLESMAMGVPVVGTNVSAIPEVLRHEKTGLVVNPKSPEAMADAIMELLTQEKLRKEVAESARALVNSEFANKKLIGDLAELHRAAGV